MTVTSKSILLADTLAGVKAAGLTSDQLEGLIQSGSLTSYYEYDVGRRVFVWNNDSLLTYYQLPMLHPLSPTAMEQSVQNDSIDDRRFTVYGGTLRRGGALFREVGVCAHDGIITSYKGQTGYKADLASLASSGVKVIRVSAGATNNDTEWVTYIGSDGTNPNSSYVTSVKAFLDECAKNGISCIITLFWTHSVISSIVGGSVSDYSNSSSDTRAYLRNFAKWWVTNFKDHNAVSAWAIGNEWSNQVGIYSFISSSSNPSLDHETPYLETVNDIYATIRSVDKVRAVISPTGNCSYYVSGDFKNFSSRFVNWAGNCEIVAYHYYPDSDTDSADQHFAVGEDLGASDTVISSLRAAALRAGKVLVVEECGAKFDSPPGTVSHTMYDYAFNSGVELVLDWNWYFDTSNAGSNDNLKDTRNVVVKSIPAYNAQLSSEYRQPLITYPSLGRFYAPSMCLKGSPTYNAQNWVSIPMDSSIQPEVGKPFFVSFWMRKTARLAQNTRLMACEDGSGGWFISTSISGNSAENLDVQFAFNGGYSGGVYSGNNPHPVANPGEWHHYCFAWDGTTKFTYWFDGLVRVRNVQSTVSNYTSTSRNLFIASSSDGINGASVDIMDVMIGKGYPTSAQVHNYVTRGAVIPSATHRYTLQNTAMDSIGNLHGIPGSGVVYGNSQIGAGV